MLYTMLVAALFGLARAEVGFSDMNADVYDWGYDWYRGESFSFYCNNSAMAVTTDHYVTWMTPSSKILRLDHDDEDFKVDTYAGISGFQLTLKNVQPQLHGVYVCQVYDGISRVKQGQIIFGMNVHTEKYRDLTEKYRSNIIVAFIATAVFVVPFATVCFVYHFQYRTQEEKDNLQKKRLTHKQFGRSEGAEFDVYKVKPSDDGAYENPDFNTQL